MRLKRVRIFGFKTFADRTDVNLGGGVIAVVGPNGCGKSNLVDAILWGLGEGNARQLRAQTGQDVIFSGASNRKPVGFAEVTLIFDNEDGGLPIDSLEVSITRKLTRSGDSEYSINKRSCRLRDVHDLLSDSGLGRAGYSIVGQKEIDQALAASAEDRRAWVDEAAGVQRYRTRKLESQRRLMGAQQHLQRVSDILSELEAQREPLRAEAEVAARYKSALFSLREVESGLLMKEIYAAHHEMVDLERRIEESMRITREEGERAARLEHQFREGEQKLLTLEGEVEVVRRHLSEQLSSVERAQAEIRLSEERLRSLDQLEQNLDTGDGKARIEQAQAERDALAAEVEAERTALAKITEEAAGAGQLARELTAQLKSVEQRLTRARQLQSENLKRQADLAHRAERSKDARRELEGIQKSEPEIDEAVEQAKAEVEALEAKLKDARDRIKLLEADVQRLRQEEDRDAQDTRKALAERSSLEGRIRGIEATIDAHEGLNQGARSVLEARERGQLKASYVPVGEAIEVPTEYALAIDIALGGSSNDLIVEHDSDAKAAIAYLKEHRLGRATFQPIPLMRPFEPSYELKKLLNEKGVVGRASELVDCKGSYRPVVDSLLGRVLIVEHLDAALRLAKTTGWSRMVTLDGEVVHSSGAVTGGTTARQSFGLVQRKAELLRLQETLAEHTKLVNEAETRTRNRSKSRAATDLSIKEQRDILDEIGSQAQEARAYFQTLHDEQLGMQRARLRLENELGKLQEEEPAEIEQVDVAAIELERDEILKALAAGSADAEQAETRLREAGQRVQQAESRFQAGDRRLKVVIDDETNREKRLAHIGPEREKFKNEIASFEQKLQHVREAKAKSESRVAALASAREECQAEQRKLSEEIRTARQNSTAVGDAVHQAELGRARADAKRAAASSRLMEEYGLSEEEALEEAPRVEVPPDAAIVTARLRRDLKAMGDVNLGSIDAFERLTVRFDELEAQRADVVNGIEQIHAGILELDKLTRERFMTTFAKVQAEFADLVNRLFGGGEGKLSLTNAESVLETGLDIEVQLPGKKKQRLELLSGGERALCASAFLFSLLKVKPSPLVVLDEVDAPLDGRNVERFNEILHEFSENTQFIVITHNPTTIQAAPIWLGVTMMEPGVSTLAPVQLSGDTIAKPA